MSKLLSEQELRDAVWQMVKNTHRASKEFEGEDRHEFELYEAQKFLDLVQSQKLAHADMVIGDADKETMPHGKKGSEGWEAPEAAYLLGRKLLRADQRQRNTL